VRRLISFLLFLASLPLGARTEASSPLVGGIAFTNNGAGRLATTKSYDSLDRLTAVSSLNSQPSTINSFTYGYNNTSLRTAITNEAGAYWAYQYDNLGQVKSGRRHWADGTPVAGQQYEFNHDDIGNVLAAGSGGDASGLNLRWTSNTFNTVNQLTARTTPGYVESFGTAHSNATVTVNLQPTYRHGEYFRAELAVNNTTALWQAVTNIGVLNNGSSPDIVTTNLSYLFVPASATTLLYDPDGNLTNDGHFSYVWNSENQLTSIASLTNTPAESKRKLTFDYDALGRRIRAGVSRWTNNTWLVTSSNKFIYDGWNLVAELNATNNTLVRSYVWGLDLSNTERDAGGVGGLLWVNDASTLGSNSTHCVAHDGNGNVTALVDAGSGNETARYEYGPFGDLTQANGLMARANPIRFSSKYHDDATGLIYYGYRFYSPLLQRWLNRDPLGEEGGLNLYGFVANDPINAVDPLGLWNYWNPATWGVRNGAGWSTADSFNPFHESASWNGYSGDYFRQSLASASGFGIFGEFDQCDKNLASTRMLGRSSTLALEIFGPLGAARWAASGTGLLRASMGLGLDSYGLYQSASAVGSGAGKLSAGDGWGAVELGLGLLGVKPGISGVMSGGRRFASDLSAARNTGFSDYVPTGEPCFVAGTLIATSEGFKQIEDIKAGDTVWSYDEKTGYSDLYPVARTFVRTTETSIKLQISDQTITTTSEHPFWVEGEGWVGAGHLKAGDEVRTLACSSETVVAVEQMVGKTTVYNFEVVGAHTYYVAKSSLLVHNACTAFGGTAGPILFGQKRIAPNFREYSEASEAIRGRSLVEVADDLMAKRISPNELPIEYFVHKGQRIAVNNRGLAALRMAGMEPTITRQVQSNEKLRERLYESAIDRFHAFPGNRIAVTINKDGSRHIYSVFGSP